MRDEGDFLDRLFSLLNGARNATIAVAVVQALAALLLISNTIQLAAFNRRNETNIMRLVGASRWYTQLPFILEAAIAGLIGGAAGRRRADPDQGALRRPDAGRADQGRASSRRSSGARSSSNSLIIAGAGVGLAGIAAYVTLRLYVRL